MNGEYVQKEEEKVNDMQISNKDRHSFYELFVDSTYLDYMLSNIEDERYKQMKHYKKNLDRLKSDLENYKIETSNN
jgi:hypothetical protein